MAVLTIYGMPLESLMGGSGGCFVSDMTIFSEITDPLRSITSTILNISIDEVLIFIPKDLSDYQPQQKGVVCFIEGLSSGSEYSAQTMDKLSGMIIKILGSLIQKQFLKDQQTKIQVIVR